MFVSSIRVGMIDFSRFNGWFDSIRYQGYTTPFNLTKSRIIPQRDIIYHLSLIIAIAIAIAIAISTVVVFLSKNDRYVYLVDFAIAIWLPCSLFQVLLWTTLAVNSQQSTVNSQLHYCDTTYLRCGTMSKTKRDNETHQLFFPLNNTVIGLSYYT